VAIGEEGPTGGVGVAARERMDSRWVNGREE
jgi:hypothetical protein